MVTVYVPHYAYPFKHKEADTQVVLVWEERLGTEPVWGVPPLCLRSSRQGGWAVLKKTPWGLVPEVVRLGNERYSPLRRSGGAGL